jgi:hypothetical protein
MPNTRLNASQVTRNAPPPSLPLSKTCQRRHFFVISNKKCTDNDENRHRLTILKIILFRVLRNTLNYCRNICRNYQKPKYKSL